MPRGPLLPFGGGGRTRRESSGPVDVMLNLLQRQRSDITNILWRGYAYAMLGAPRLLFTGAYTSSRDFREDSNNDEHSERGEGRRGSSSGYDRRSLLQ